MSSIYTFKYSVLFGVTAVTDNTLRDRLIFLFTNEQIVTN